MEESLVRVTGMAVAEPTAPATEPVRVTVEIECTAAPARDVELSLCLIPGGAGGPGADVPLFARAFGPLAPGRLALELTAPAPAAPAAADLEEVHGLILYAKYEGRIFATVGVPMTLALKDPEQPCALENLTRSILNTRPRITNKIIQWD